MQGHEAKVGGADAAHCGYTEEFPKAEDCPAGSGDTGRDQNPEGRRVGTLCQGSKRLKAMTEDCLTIGLGEYLFGRGISGDVWRRS
jgi:hypothetical protein